MKLTPLEIRKMDFSKSLRGYKAEEVRAFLETLADQVEALHKESNDYTDKIVRLETRLADFQSMEKTLQDTLLKAEETAHRSRAESQREAELTLREAQLEAQRLMLETKNYIERLRSDILMLQSQKDAFVKKLKYLLQSQLELVNILEKDDATMDTGLNGSKA